jgi:hypothetical protein
MRAPLLRTVHGLASLGLATLVWLPSLHLFHPETDHDEALERRVHADWAEGPPADTDALRRANPEWDFMRRTFVVLALVDRALSENASAEERERSLALVDRVIDDTLGRESTHGHAYFLLPYAHRAPFVGTRGGEVESLFVDGEIAMMIAARMLVAARPDLDAELDARVLRIRAQMEAGPVLSGESYPDECWTFCNTFALAALRTVDAVRGEDAHRAFAERWLRTARERLVDDDTGLLVSSYTWDGAHLDGPEGSSIFMSAANLLLVDEAFARDQYVRAKRELGASFLGFGWAREWPESASAFADVDSGPIVPFVDVSAGASGLAILGAHVFGDAAFSEELAATLDFAAFPTEGDDGLRFGASNAVGDAVVFFAETAGPRLERTRALLRGERTASPAKRGAEEALR